MQPSNLTPDDKKTQDFYSFFTGYGQSAISTLNESIGLAALSAKVLLNTFQQIDVEALKVAKSFGQGRENTLAIKQVLVDAAPAVERLGGNFSKVAEIQNELTKALGRNVLLSSESFEKLYATTQVTGKEASDLFPKFKDVGISAYGVAENMQKIVDISRQQGLSVQAVSTQAMNNMEAINKYNFQGGVDGLAKMAAQATSLRIDMGTALKFGENLYKPEKAIEMAAALQRLGVTQSELLDPLRLMDLSINDPAELQNQLVQMTQQFVTMGEAGNFEIAPEGKLRLRELQEATGIAYSELTKMAIGGAELEDKLSKIRFPSFLTDEQQKMIANLAEMKDGEYVITVGNETKSLAEALSDMDTTEEFNKLIEASEPKTMEEMTREGLSIQERMAADLAVMSGRVPRGLATTKAGDTAANALTGLIDGIADLLTDRGVLSSKSFRDVTDKSADIGVDMISQLLTGNMNLTDGMGKLVDTFTEFGGTQLDNLILNLGEQREEMSKSSNAFAKIGTDLINKIDEFITKQFGITIPSQRSAADESLKKEIETKNTETKTEQKTITTSSTVDVNIKLEVPAGMSESAVKDALGTEDIKQEIVKIVKEKYPDMKIKE